MLEIYIWGSGHFADLVLRGIEFNHINMQSNGFFRIKGIIDNDSVKHGQMFHGLKILKPIDAIKGGFDYISILIENDWDVSIQAKYGYRIPEEKVKDKFFLLKLLLLVKYSDSEDLHIKKCIEYLRNHDISMFNNYLPQRKAIHEVIWDGKLNLPYIEFPDITEKVRRMYFPRNYQFIRADGMQKCLDMLWEQSPSSPHLYVCDNHNIKEGDVIIDGGVCEGNFALRYASIASKLYMFECDWWWDEANYYTFLPFKEKIVYSHKALLNKNGDTFTTIDRAIPEGEKVDFIKLDIEGYESDAIEGAKRVLELNDVKLSICAYHHADDELLIENRLKHFGYYTFSSKGYVVFLWDDDIWFNLDFRRCVIYAEKGSDESRHI